MASLQQDPSGNFHISFRFGGQRFKRSLKTKLERKASATASHLEENIRLAEMGRMIIPEGVDVPTFLLSDGNLFEKPQLTRVLSINRLFQEYQESIPEGALESSTLRIAAVHMRHFERILGSSKKFTALTKTDLQHYVTTRSQKNGLRGKISPRTIKKELATLRMLWNWAKTEELVTTSFPNKGIIFPKETEKPPFQTWAQIKRQIKQGNLNDDEAAKLWDCLYLDRTEIKQLLEHVRQHARYPFLHPMSVIAAHSGARRSELCRLRVFDVDLAESTITIHERKRSRSTRTTRVVPMTKYVHRIISDWMAEKEEGSSLFPEDHRCQRNRKDRDLEGGVSPDEASHHLEQTLSGSKWEIIRGWHTLRHSFISNCATHGVDQRFIDQWVGHQTEEQSRRYRHLFPNSQQVVIEGVFD